MVTYVQAIILGLLQGVSELFPISSLGHSVIFPSLVGWHINQKDPLFLPFLVATHLATSIVLFGFFFNDWKKILTGMGRSLRDREIKSDDIYAKLGWLLVVGTIPAGILGLLFEEKLRTLFASPLIAAGALALNGTMLFLAEIIRKKRKDVHHVYDDARVAKISWKQTLAIGASQAIALIPGFSRTGSTLTGGLAIGLSHKDAVRFSFLLATPIIAAAAILKIPDLATADGVNIIGQVLAGAVCSGIAAYFSVKFLTKYFETNTLMPFAVYCFLAGSGSLLFLLFR